MLHTEFEILRSYKHAKNKREQIRILAELNAEGYTDADIEKAKEKIVMILQKNGVLEATKETKKILRKNYLESTKEYRTKAFRLFSRYVADCITAMDSASPTMYVEYVKDIDDVRRFLLDEPKA